MPGKSFAIFDKAWRATYSSRPPERASFLKDWHSEPTLDNGAIGVRFWLKPHGFLFCLLLIIASTATGQDPATVGQWSAVTTWPYMAVHAHVLPTGKVMWWPAFALADNSTL